MKTESGTKKHFQPGNILGNFQNRFHQLFRDFYALYDHLFFYNLFKKEEKRRKEKKKIIVNFFLTKSLLKILKNVFNETIKTFKTNLPSHTLAHFLISSM